jgi:hypothetical protein
MRPGPAIQAALLVEHPRPAFPSPEAKGRPRRFDSARCERHLCRYELQNRDSKNRVPATDAAASGLTSSLSWQLRRPQCPGNQHALARISDFPLAIHSRELPTPTGVTAIIVRQALRVPTFSMNPLWGRTLHIATEKHYTSVNKLWTMRLPCGRLRKMWKEF